MRKLTEKQEAYAQNRGKGVARTPSAVMAGYAVEDDGSPAPEKSTAVIERIAEIRAETATNAQITKEEVVQMLMDAAGYAKILGDSMGLVAAAREIGKMCGFYAPEVKKVLHGLEKGQLKKALQELDDDELYKLAHAKTIDGTSTRIPEKV